MDILNHIDLVIPDHKLVVFTGPNGGGKTTLAKSSWAWYSPRRGRSSDGQDITGLSITERAKLGISYGFPAAAVQRASRCTICCCWRRATKLNKDKCCCQYLTKVGLCANDYLDREVDVSLSGGEVKRIEIATILARNSRLMIFDEPEAGIDLWSFARLTETFEQIHRRARPP